MVGSEIFTKGKGSTLAGAQMVSPMVMLPMPLSGNDVAGGCLSDRHTVQTVELVKADGLELLGDLIGIMIVAYRDLVVLMDHTALDPANGDPAHKLVIVDGGHQHLERLDPHRPRGRGYSSRMVSNRG